MSGQILLYRTLVLSQMHSSVQGSCRIKRMGALCSEIYCLVELGVRALSK